MERIPAEQRDLELRVYDLVPPSFHRDNLEPIGGINPTAQFIAGKYGCRLDFREGYFKPNFVGNIIRPPEVNSDYSCTMAVLVGKDYEKLAQAREEIQRTFGVFKRVGAVVK